MNTIPWDAIATVVAVVMPLMWQGSRNRRRVEAKVEPVSNGFAAKVISRLDTHSTRLDSVAERVDGVAERLDEHIAVSDNRRRSA